MYWTRVVMAAALVPLVSVVCAQQQRPYLRYEGDPEALRKAVGKFLEMSEQELLEGLVAGDRRAQENAAELGAVDNLIALAEVAGEQAASDRALLILKTISGPFLEASDEELRVQITERGAQDASNLLMRDVSWDLARVYHLSRDQGAAHRAAVILARLAEVMPGWPLVTRAGELKDQDDEDYRLAWDANGLWGVWFCSDITAGLPVVRAYDLIYDSGAMQQLGAVEWIGDDLLRHIPEHYFERTMSLGNLTHYMLKSLPLYGMAIPEPKYVHIVVQRYRYLINAVYYADGFWHEGSPSYHKDITTGLARSVPAVLKGYSDPPGYTCDIDLPRYDNLDLAAEYERQHTRMWDALKKLTFPNKDYAKTHDASFPHGAWWDVRPTESYPRILGCMGHAILGTNADPDQAQLHLHYSGAHGHEHYDALSIILFARGKELLSETKYRAPEDWASTREWQTMTAGHNTVVIDERNQEGRFPDASHRRPITEADAMDDIPNWRYRSGGHGNALNDGKLRCFCPDWDAVQVAEAEAERAYFPDPELYRRTVALVHVDEHEVYVVDIFRVRGGAVHDWMLHGCLQFPYELATSMALSPMEGELHKYLDQLRSAETDDGWTATFSYEEGSSLRTHILGQPGSRVIVGRGPAMRHAGYADFFDVRRETGESCFVAVHDPYQGEPNVESIEPVAWGEGPMDVGLRINLANGFTDLVLSSAQNPPFSEHVLAGTGAARRIGAPPHTGVAPHIGAPTFLSAFPEGITFAGRFAHIRFQGDRLVHAYGVDASHLKVGETELTGPGYYEGEIIRTHRIEGGAEFDAFETDAKLPAGMEGRCLVVDLGGTLTQAFIIDRVEPTETGAMIYSKDEPGMEIRGDLIKMMYYSGWGIPRPCRFQIADTLLWPQAGGG